jgi:hypothetical protein
MRISRQMLLYGLMTAMPYCDFAWAQETGISIEAVDRYSCGPLSNNIANVDNFRTQMLSIPGYTVGVRYTDGQVFSTDFTDPERVSGGADTFNFDRPGDAIAYFSGHGTCDDRTTTACTSTGGCPNVGGVEKRCLRFTDNPLQGRCMYSQPRTILVDRTGTSCESVDYSTNGVVGRGSVGRIVGRHWYQWRYQFCCHRQQLRHHA